MAPGEEDGHAPWHELLSIAIAKGSHKEAVSLPVPLPAVTAKPRPVTPLGGGGAGGRTHLLLALVI